MEIIEKKRKTNKRIVFDISDKDHELIKSIAAKKRMPMRTWIIKAMAQAIRMDNLDLEITIK